jgi:hypothetical protein
MSTSPFGTPYDNSAMQKNTKLSNRKAVGHPVTKTVDSVKKSDASAWRRGLIRNPQRLRAATCRLGKIAASRPARCGAWPSTLTLKGIDLDQVLDPTLYDYSGEVGPFTTKFP